MSLMFSEEPVQDLHIASTIINNVPVMYIYHKVSYDKELTIKSLSDPMLPPLCFLLITNILQHFKILRVSK